MEAALDATKGKEESAISSSRSTGLRYCVSSRRRDIAQVRYLIGTSSDKKWGSLNNYLYFYLELKNRPT
tara:strand:+ start:9722 stop:9928 length:207 start_codon:yes stop_codon:yes gene_type:complete